MTSRALLLALFLAATGCDPPAERAVSVSAVGRTAAIANPNLVILDPPSAFLLEATAFGLVRFDGSGEIEPALAQRWIVSDDGLRYTFRLARADWPGGGPIRAEQVAARLRASFGASSRNPLKPLLGAIDEIEAMTDDVLEISLKSSRPNFLQLLAQPEMAIMRSGRGLGAFTAERQAGGAILLTEIKPADAEGVVAPPPATVMLRGEGAALGVARFQTEGADLVTGGAIGDLAYARAVRLQPGLLAFDPVQGLFGLVVRSRDGSLGEKAVRAALAMAIDRDGLAAAFAPAPLRPRVSLLPAGIAEHPAPALPDWASLPNSERVRRAAAAIAAASPGERLTLKVALPDRPGFKLVLARLKRDWARIGVDARRVWSTGEADLALVDQVAPAGLASWYLRTFECGRGPLCDTAADEAMAAARTAPDAEARRTQLAIADRALTDAALFIPLGEPVRWSLVSPRLTGFRPNRFARHPAGELLAARP